MKRTLIILAIIAIATLTTSYHVHIDNGQAIGQVSYIAALPDKHLTPGKADTLDVKDLQRTYNGQTYSQSHRNVSDKVKRQVYAEYNTPYPQNGAIEVDHLHALCAGGSNDISNLWIQQKHMLINGEDWGYPVKDRLEAWGCAQIKKGLLKPIDFYTGIVNNWVEYYQLHRNEIEKTPALIGGVPIE